jgi:hypothetical protein
MKLRKGNWRLEKHRGGGDGTGRAGRQYVSQNEL